MQIELSTEEIDDLSMALRRANVLIGEDRERKEPVDKKGFFQLDSEIEKNKKLCSKLNELKFGTIGAGHK